MCCAGFHKARCHLVMCWSGKAKLTPTPKTLACCSLPPRLQILLPTRPTASIDGAPLLNYTAGQTVPLNATNTTCSGGCASYDWSIDCASGANATKTGATALLTTGGAYTDVPLPTPSYTNCTVQIAVTDNYNQTSTANASLILNAAAGPSAVIAGAPLNATAGDTVALDSTGTVCTTATCTYEWTVDCGGSYPVVNRAGATASAQTGFTAAAAINMAGSMGLNCSVELAVTDEFNVTGTATTFLQVRLPVCHCASGQRSTRDLGWSMRLYAGECGVARGIHSLPESHPHSASSLPDLPQRRGLLQRQVLGVDRPCRPPRPNLRCMEGERGM